MMEATRRADMIKAIEGVFRNFVNLPGLHLLSETALEAALRADPLSPLARIAVLEDEIEFHLAEKQSIEAATIERLREPTEQMVCVGDEKIIEALQDHTFALRDPTPAKACWQAMFDEAIRALARPPKGEGK